MILQFLRSNKNLFEMNEIENNYPTNIVEFISPKN